MCIKAISSHSQRHFRHGRHGLHALRDLDLVSEADVEEGERDCNEFQEKFYAPVDANRATQFISAYSQGLTGAEAAWANQKYHGHRILPPYMLEQVTKTFQNK